MKRVEIAYGGQKYSVPNRDIADLRSEIGDALGAGKTHWLEVNSGEGILEPAYLLISPGVPIALLDVMRTVSRSEAG
ncbi:hypothetical protein [Mycetocola zhujimingii]|uniref:Uncharacterized protein n=1 Tax=Mycetocola zhujimingii TaxID=2079792 RepID=A0A2U1TG03_9MICO|nr:hypothetical protein [Mycetocola zhujimingii]AWB86265.1 hypothetical protein C3E77_06320 [Mycetocola zhujimingii]PWC07819.1 hypothetical protein DF223_00140 [Mycetocola zhujimingii]